MPESHEHESIQFELPEQLTKAKVRNIFYDKDATNATTLGSRDFLWPSLILLTQIIYEHYLNNLGRHCILDAQKKNKHKNFAAQHSK